MKTKLLIYGAGKLGLQVLDLIKYHLTNDFDVLGFVDDTKPTGEIVHEQLKTFGSIDNLSPKDSNLENVKIAMAIGYKDRKGRQQAYDRAKRKGFEFATIVHPKSHIEKSVIQGEGNIFLAGVLVDHNVRIGNVNYFDLGCKIAEWSQVGSHNYFAEGATLAGETVIGDRNFLGVNSTVVNGISIADNNFINAQTLVARNVDSNNHVIQATQVRMMKI